MKKILSILIAVSMLLSVCPVSAKSVFTDVPDGHWAEKQIDAWSEYGVISGYNGEFAPGRSITRGEFAVVLNKLMTYEKTVENKFADLGEKYYTDSILKLNKAGVMQGYENKISPENSLTREEAAIMICRALGIETQEKVNKTFSDYASVSDWARPYINALVNEGLLNGSDGKLNPKNTITRAEVVTILDNAVLPILESGEYGNIETDKILVISKGRVTLNNSKIGGKIIITQGAKSGNITFLDSEINGDVSIDNDRKDFIILENTEVTDEDLLDHKAFVQEKDKDDDKSGGGDSGSSGGPGGSGPSGGKDDDDDDNTGDSGNTGGNEGGNTGDSGNTGGNEGGNTGDSGNTGDNEGGNTGDSGNTGGNEGGNTGDDNTGDDEEPDYGEINDEMVDNLKLISDDIAMYIDPLIPDFYSVFTNEEKYILRRIKICIDDAITHKNEVEIDADYIKSEYEEEILDVKAVYDDMELGGRAGGFHSRLFVNLNSYTLLWLADTLGIDLSEYGINPGDYTAQ